MRRMEGYVKRAEQLKEVLKKQQEAPPPAAPAAASGGGGGGGGHGGALPCCLSLYVSVYVIGYGEGLPPGV